MAAIGSGGRSPCCWKPKSGSAAVDVAVFFIVIVALGFLAYPCIRLLVLLLIGGIGSFLVVLGEEIHDAPLIYGLVGASVCCTGIGCWLIVVTSGRKCANPKCKGLKKAAEFDIQLETEEYMRNLSNTSGADQGGRMLRRGVFELPRDHHQELEEELRKMAPVNGRAVLLFRARCGCVIGRLGVPGLKKQRKVKMKK
ncbi:hypothetical protein MLD38_022531 [Melastoma candidum]|uniref:Uncharacterized protein n=1 Tax=Melastoma candidum TaxID=119954 RepID=A0ACB9QKR6_9MYRT|nr:hypothetical protein MLD38_022531 [Melastoma candidum]